MLCSCFASDFFQARSIDWPCSLVTVGLGTGVVCTFWFYKTIRDYFETSHGKGPQDGAGANLKHKEDMEVIKRKAIIQNAKDLFKFAQDNLKTPAPSRYQSVNVQLKTQVFFYVEKVDRDRRGRYFKEVKGNRSIRSVLS